jgi:hypothetical protein
MIPLGYFEKFVYIWSRILVSCIEIKFLGGIVSNFLWQSDSSQLCLQRYYLTFIYHYGNSLINLDWTLRNLFSLECSEHLMIAIDGSS